MPDDARLPDPTIPREALLRLPEVCRLTGLSETVIYEKVAAGQFPLAKQVSSRVVAWPAARVLDWMAALPDVAPGRVAVHKKSRAA